MGCFQVFEDHEGIEADIRRRLAGLGGGPEARSSGQRPLCWWSPPAPPSGAPSRPPAAPPCCPGIRLWPSWRSRPPAPSAMAQAHATPSPCPAGPGTGFGWPSSGSWSPSRGRWWSVRNSRGGSLPAPPPRRRWQWLGPFCCWGSLRSSSPPRPRKAPGRDPGSAP